MAIAVTDTLLKKQPVQGSTLPDNQKVTVPTGKSYDWKVLKNDGLHAQVELSHGAGVWWVFLPHWKTPEPEKTPGTGKVEAVFTMAQRRTSQLIEGNLTFTRDGGQLLRVVATSGSAGYQYPGAHSVRGRGCLPPSRTWKISTSGYYLATKGVEGMFYHITPDPFLGRSELGLHRDANVPGSAGCIVVRSSTIFNEKVVPLIDSLKGKQSHIPLSVIYL